jgi:hypothetical protein
VLVDEPVERQELASALDRSTLSALSCIGIGLATRNGTGAGDGIGEQRRAIFGFIQTGFPQHTGAVTIWPPLDDEVLSFSGEAVTYRELLLTGAATGLVSRLVVEAGAGEGLLRSSPEGPPRDAVRAEAKRFRLARHLESGEDLRVWLASRVLALDDFDQYLSRAVARADLGSAEPYAGELDVEPGELTSKLLFAELAFSGAWRACADTAVRLFAAERLARQGNPGSAHPEEGRAPTSEHKLGLPTGEVLKVLGLFGSFDPAWCAERLGVFRSRAHVLDEIERQVRGSASVQARLEDSRLEWALFRYDELALGSRAAAMEALSCARADGLPAEEIARRAGTELAVRRVRREQLLAGHAAVLDAAAQDEAVGPVEGEGSFSVLWLRHRATPDGDDPEVVERAVAGLLSEALERAATGAVRELGQL